MGRALGSIPLCGRDEVEEAKIGDQVDVAQHLSIGRGRQGDCEPSAVRVASGGTSYLRRERYGRTNGTRLP